MRKSLSALAPMSRRGIRGGDCRLILAISVAAVATGFAIGQ
jgi:hypothetical protein